MDFVSTSNAIKGYSTSKIATRESNDCVVRAMASAFDITYDESHNLCASQMNRISRNGVRTFRYHRFLSQSVILGKEVNEITMEPVRVETEKKSRYWNETYTSSKTLNLWTKRGSKYSALTVGAFIKRYPLGTYILSVKGHTFTVKDSVVIGGNFSDSTAKRVRIEKVFRVN